MITRKHISFHQQTHAFHQQKHEFHQQTHKFPYEALLVRGIWQIYSKLGLLITEISLRSSIKDLSLVLLRKTVPLRVGEKLEL
ncbi:hypothetical protein H6G91_40255 [Nostoc muscorum FACHB-395]|nr:hypothetical protein [Desmonostoc muscorum FACHB-395]